MNDDDFRGNRIIPNVIFYVSITLLLSKQRRGVVDFLLEVIQVQGFDKLIVKSESTSHPHFGQND